MRADWQNMQVRLKVVHSPKKNSLTDVHFAITLCRRSVGMGYQLVDHGPQGMDPRKISKSNEPAENIWAKCLQFSDSKHKPPSILQQILCCG